jgi:PAS domain S-box-containing protein
VNPRDTDRLRQAASGGVSVEELRRRVARILDRSQWQAKLLSRAIQGVIDAEDELHGMGAAVIIVDAARTIVHWSMGAEVLYGWSREEAMGRSFLELVIHPDCALGALRTLATVRREGTWEGEVSKRAKDGSTFRAFLLASALKNQDGDPTDIIGVSVAAPQDPRTAQEA